MMSKPCLKSSLFVTPIFIYSEAGGVFFGWGGCMRTSEISWFSGVVKKKMTDIAQDDEGDVSAHRPSGFTAQIKYVRMVLNWLL